MINFSLYAITVAIWGSTWLVITFQLQDSAATTAVGWRFILASLMLLAWCLARRVSLRFSPKQYALILVQGLANFSFNYWCVYLAEARIPSGLVAVIFTLLLVFNMLGGRLFFRQRIGWRGALGASFGVLGVLLVFWPEVSRFDSGGAAWFGLLFSLCATLFSSVGNLMSVQTQKSGIGVIPTITIGMGMGGACMLAISALTGKSLAIPLTPVFLSSLLYLSLFGSVIAFAAYLNLIGRVGAGPASYNGVIIPIVALTLSTLYEGYQWQVASISGVVLALLGNWLVMRGKAPRDA
jgi:drug/metabolite transporter (DMT)-like permease